MCNLNHSSFMSVFAISSKGFSPGYSSCRCLSYQVVTYFQLLEIGESWNQHYICTNPITQCQVQQSSDPTAPSSFHSIDHRSRNDHIGNTLNFQKELLSIALHLHRAKVIFLKSHTATSKLLSNYRKQVFFCKSTSSTMMLRIMFYWHLIV